MTISLTASVSTPKPGIASAGVFCCCRPSGRTAIQERSVSLFSRPGRLRRSPIVCLQETDLRLVGVVDDRRTKPFFGVPVRSPRALTSLRLAFMRPAALAADDTPGVAIVLHALEWLEIHERYQPDIVVHLPPTSPFRTPSDIDGAVALLSTRGTDAVVGVMAVQHRPYWMKTIDDDGWMRDCIEQAEPTFRRQDLPPVYSVNGAVYVAYRDLLKRAGGWFTGRTAAYITPFERSIDIDTPWNLALASFPHSGSDHRCSAGPDVSTEDPGPPCDRASRRGGGAGRR